MTDRDFETMILPLIDDDARRLERLKLPELLRALAVRLESAPPRRYAGLAEAKRHAREVVIDLAGALIEAGAVRR